MKRISDANIELILFWLGKGLSVRKIKEKTGFSISTISKYAVISKEQKTKNSAGRHLKVSFNVQRLLVRLILAGFLRNSSDARKYLKNMHNLEVSQQTIRNILHKNGLVNRVKPLKPRLLDRHKEARLIYAKTMKKKPENFWESVIFTDESKYNLLGPDGFKRVWLRPGAPLQNHQVRQVVKFGGGKVSVWGAITYQGMGELVFIEGNMNKEQYIHILSTGYLKTLRNFKMKVSNTWLLQDNDPKHTALKTLEWIQSKKIKLIPHPACSPDMNPIEHVWNDVNIRLRAREKKPTTIEELKQAVEEEWYNTPLTYIQALYNSMGNRIKALEKAKGGFTKY